MLERSSDPDRSGPRTRFDAVIRPPMLAGGESGIARDPSRRAAVFSGVGKFFPVAAQRVATRALCVVCGYVDVWSNAFMSDASKSPAAWEVESEEKSWLLSLRLGMSIRDVADEAGVTQKRISEGVASAIRREALSPPVVARRRPLPSLTLAFGSSGKPFALLTCADVHPPYRVVRRRDDGTPYVAAEYPDGFRPGSGITCAVCNRAAADVEAAIGASPEPYPEGNAPADGPRDEAAA